MHFRRLWPRRVCRKKPRWSLPTGEAWQNYRNRGLAPLIAAAAAHDVSRFNALIPVVSQLDRQYEIVLDQVLSVHQKYAKTLNEEASHDFVSGLVIIASIAVLFVVVIFAVSLLMKRVVFAPVNWRASTVARLRREAGRTGTDQA